MAGRTIARPARFQCSQAAAFEVTGLPAAATADVIGEDRRIAVKGGRFTDTFGPHAVHLYRIR